MTLTVLYEDNHLLAVSKPAGLATMGAAPGKPTLLNEARSYIKGKYDKPGNVYLGVMSRLDAMATGVVLLARTSKAAARLTEQFRSHRVEKSYLALVEGAPEPAHGACSDWLCKNDAAHRMEVVSEGTHGAKQARLSYRTRQRLRRGALLDVRLETGRKHQIRVQLAARGWPIVGDRKYGARTRFAAGIALHASRIVITHPVRREPLEIEAPLPDHWRPALRG